MNDSVIGFIGLGNVGAKLAGSLLRNGADLTVLDIDEERVRAFTDQGAAAAAAPRELAERCGVVVTCLPSPAVCAEVMEGEDGVLGGLGPGAVWMEMSTTDRDEVLRLGAMAQDRGAAAVDCPVSGGCHRAATGNISIFCGGTRESFDRVLPVLKMMGRRILHTGPLGSASVLKVVTNYLASVHLAALGEAFAVASRAGMDLTTTYEAIRISSGNSFVHETESQVILNGSYDIGFTMDLVQKDMGLFLELAERAGVDLDVAPVVGSVFDDAARRYGPRALSPMVVRRLEEAIGAELRAPGFPAEIIDQEPESPGQEVEVGIGPRTLEKEKQMTLKTKTIAAWHHTKGVARTTANGSREVAISLWHKWQTRRKCELCGLNKVGSYMSDLTQLVPYGQSWTDEDGHHEDAGYSHPKIFTCHDCAPLIAQRNTRHLQKGAEKRRRRGTTRGLA